MLPWPRSLFLKFFLTFWLATLLAFVAGRFVMDWAGFGPRKDNKPPHVRRATRAWRSAGLPAGHRPLFTRTPPPPPATSTPTTPLASEPWPGAPDAMSGGLPKCAFGGFAPGASIGPLPDPRRRLPGPPPPGPGGQFFLLVPVISGVLSSLLASLALAWYLTKPLRHLHWGVDRVADGRFDTRIRPHMGRRRDELVDLADRFDHMTEQLQQLTEARTRLFHDLSHELRSPLGRMRAAMGLIRQDPSEAGAMVERIDREIERLDGLVNELLTLHRLEAGASHQRNDHIDLIELLREIAEDAGFEAASTGRRLSLQATGRFVAQVDGELLYRAFENVIRNAIKFTGPDTAVEVSASVFTDEAGRRLKVSVSDRGPGASDALLKAMFDPFVRGDNGTQGVGHGLGLAIARRAVRAHGGDIAAHRREGGGLVIDIELPERVPGDGAKAVQSGDSGSGSAA